MFFFFPLNFTYFEDILSVQCYETSCKWVLLFSLSRLDFQNFQLSQPDSTDNQCRFDQFIVSGGSSPVPAICGSNSGQHSNNNFSYNIADFHVLFSLNCEINFFFRKQKSMCDTLSTPLPLFEGNVLLEWLLTSTLYIPVYVDMGLAYNNPVTLTVVSSGSTSSTRSFSIKVTQIECSSLNRGTEEAT